MIFIYLSSGLFLGWSLGANDAGNVFGTAVGTKMLRFKMAALVASIFFIIGAVAGGSGAAHTLGRLGAVNAIAGSFMVALGAAFAVFFMTKLSLPVSTSQAIVGAIIGWNLFSGMTTDSSTLTKIVSTWVLCPVLAALFAIILYFLTKILFAHVRIHLLEQDHYTRLGLIAVGAFGAYSLGANNIANVMGVFVPAVPFDTISVYGLFSLSGAQQLFLLGGIAIAVGVYTYSYRVMDTIGSGLFKLSPVTALLVVLSQALVLFLFSSEQLEAWLISQHLPTIPLVPVSSSQAVIGGVIGIGLAKGAHNIQYRKLISIASGWVTTPIIAGIITFVGLFFLQNVFTQEVSKKITWAFSDEVIIYLDSNRVDIDRLQNLTGKSYYRSGYLYSLIKNETGFSAEEVNQIIEAALVSPIFVDVRLIDHKIDSEWFSENQISALRSLAGKHYEHHWQLYHDLVSITDEWRFLEKTKTNKMRNNEIRDKLNFIYSVLSKEYNQ